MNIDNERKEEILEKSRQLQHDEGMEYAVEKGTMLGHRYTGSIGVLLILLSLMAGEMLTIYALLTLFSVHHFGEFFSHYRHFKQKRYIVGFVFFGLISGAFFAFLFVRDIGTLQGWWG